MGCLWLQKIMFEVIKYRGAMFDGTEDWWKLWRKTDLWFQKWHEKFGTFSPEHSKVSKLGLWWDPLIQSRKGTSLKLTGELCVMTMNNDANSKRDWLTSWKLTWGIWWILPQALENLKTLYFNGLLWPKYIMFQLEKYREVNFDGTKDWCKIWRKTDLCFQKWHKKFDKFSHAEK